MTKKVNILENVISLLGKLQDRLSKVSLQQAKNLNELAALRNEVRLKTTQLHERTTGLQAEMDRAWVLNNSRAEIVKKLSADTTASLNELKSSTQRGFDGVRLDMEKALRSLQSMNARCSELEGRVRQLEESNSKLVSAAQAYTADVERFERVRAALAQVREAFGE